MCDFVQKLPYTLADAAFPTIKTDELKAIHRKTKCKADEFSDRLTNWAEGIAAKLLIGLRSGIVLTPISVGAIIVASRLAPHLSPANASLPATQWLTSIKGFVREGLVAPILTELARGVAQPTLQFCAERLMPTSQVSYGSYSNVYEGQAATLAEQQREQRIIWVSIVLTSALWATVRGGGLTTQANRLVMGISLGWLRQYSKDSAAPVAAHITNQMLTTAALMALSRFFGL